MLSWNTNRKHCEVKSLLLCAYQQVDTAHYCTASSIRTYLDMCWRAQQACILFHGILRGAVAVITVSHNPALGRWPSNMNWNRLSKSAANEKLRTAHQAQVRHDGCDTSHQGGMRLTLCNKISTDRIKGDQNETYLGMGHIYLQLMS